MTNTEGISYLYRLALHSGITDNGELKSWAEDCLRLGIRDFWGASEWSFRTYEYDLAIASETDDYALPADFAGVTTVKEKDSLQGRELTYYPKAHFDRLVPKPLASPATYSQIYTIWYDKNDEKNYIRFFPPPETGHTIVMEIVSKPPADLKEIDEAYVGGVFAQAQKYMYPLHKGRLQAWAEARMEIKRLEITDSPHQGKPFIIFDDTDIGVEVARPWQ